MLDQNPSAQYALAEMSGDEVPELILQGESAGNGSLRLYLVYYVDPGGDQSTALLAGGHLYVGVAQVGGYRGVLAAASGQPGVYCTEWYSGAGSGDITLCTLQGEALVSSTVAEFEHAEFPDLAQADIE